MIRGVDGEAQRRESESLLRSRFAQDPLYAPHAEVFFEVLEELGRGGVGSVLRVRDHRLGRELALKTLKDQVADPETEERFLREARLTARLCHPNIPPVHEAGRSSSGHLYILMRIIEGETLRERIRAYHDRGRKPEELRRLLEVMVKVCEAIAYAHAKGVVHRDLKPSNIMIGAYGEVMVLDWGLAKDLNETEPEVERPRAPAIEAEEGLTLPGTLMGTPGYMAPEQAAGQAVDARADVFAIGATLFELLTAALPVEGDTVMARVIAASKGAIRAPRDLDAAAPRELDALIRHALALKKARRPSAEILAEELRAYLAGAPLKTIRYRLTEQLARAARRHAGPILGLAALLLLVTAVVAVWVRLNEASAASKAAEERARVAKREAKRDMRRAKTRLEKEKRRRREEQARIEEMLRRFGQARNLAVKGANREDLKRVIEGALSKDNRSYRGLLEGGRIFRGVGCFDEARALFEEACGFPPAYEAWMQLHDLEVMTGGRGPAIDTPGLRGLLAPREEEEGEPGVLVLWARAHALFLDARGRFGHPEATRRLREALALLERARALDKRLGHVYLTKGLAFTELGDDEKASECFREAVKVRPRFLPARHQFALLCLNNGDIARALDECQKAFMIYGRDAFNHLVRARCLSYRGDTKTALDSLERARSLKPDYQLAYLETAEISCGTGAWRQAAAAALKAIELDPEDPRARCVHALASWKLGRLEDAREAFDKAVAIDPDDPDPYNKRGGFFLEIGELDRASKDLDKALELAPDHPMALIKSGRLAITRGRQLEKARRRYRRFLARWPRHRMAKLVLGSLEGLK